jgi:hypothetical protein
MSIFFPPVKPNIDRTNLQNLVVKVGLTLTLDVNITGEPPPEVTWLFEGKVSFIIMPEHREPLLSVSISVQEHRS